MLSPVVVKRICDFINFLSYIGIVPFSWNSKERQIRKSVDRWKIWSFYVGVFLSLIQCAFQIFRLVEQKQLGSQLSTINFTFTTYWLIVHSLIACFNINTVLKIDELQTFLSQFIRLAQQSSLAVEGGDEDFMRLKHKTNKTVVTFVVTFTCLAIVCVVSSMALFLQIPFAPVYFSSVVPSGYHGLMVMTVFTVFELVHYATFWGSLLLYIFLTVIYMVTMSAWLSRLKEDCRKKANKQKVYMQFKCLSVLNQSCTRATHPFVTVGHKVIVVPMTVASSYGVLYMFKWIHEAPLVYGIYVMTLFGTMTFQMVWYRTSMELYSPSVIIHRYFISMNWSRGLPYPFKKLYRNLPGRYGPFSIFRQWKPQVFLKKIFVSTMKIHFYVRK